MTDTIVRPAAATDSKNRRGKTYLLAGLTALLVVGMVVQAAMEWRDLQRHPAPGQMVEIDDGRRIHVQLSGTDHDGPIAILEAGAGSFSPQWAWVQRELSEYMPVLSYDRAGLGWSDTPDWKTRSADAVVSDLTQVLDALGLEGPYVLLGHSFGGVYARMFAHARPDDIVGVILVDPAHEEQFVRVPAMGSLTELTILPHAARIGLLRLLAPFDELGEGMPADVFAEWRAVGYTVRYLQGFRDEGRHVRDVVSPWFTERDRHIGDTPLVVLQAADAEWPDNEVRLLQRELLDMSNKSHWAQINGADHFTIVTHEHHARRITDAVRSITR